MKALELTPNRISIAKSGEDKIQAISQAIFLVACAFIHYCGRELARALGDQNLDMTYRQILDEDSSSTIRRFFDVLIKLEAFREFPFKEIEELTATLRTNNVAMTSLRLAVAERLDMKPLPPSDLQRACEMVQMSLKPRILAKHRR